MLSSTLIFILGVALIVWRNEISKALIEAQHNNFRTKFSEKEVNDGPMGILIMGLLFIAFAAYRYFIKCY